MLVKNYKDLSLDPQYPHKKPGTGAHAYNSNTGEAETGRPFEMACWPASLVDSVNARYSRYSERPPSRKLRFPENLSCNSVRVLD